MSRIQTTFAQLQQQGRKALIPYLMSGYPHKDSTTALMHAAVQAGADLIELGVPFSDPMADGPVIQQSSAQALEAGMTVDRCFELTAKAIELLAANPKAQKDGFFLFVEGSKVDWAAHSNDPAGLVSDLLAFDAAVGATTVMGRL